MVEVEVSNLHFRIWSQPVDIDILTGKRCRLLECAKTLLDIAQESADWSPPLKCAVAGVFALIKDCEQFQDAKKKIEGLRLQLNRFERNIAAMGADMDRATARRRRLVSTFKEIEEISQKLLAKSAIARFADKGRTPKWRRDLSSDVMTRDGGRGNTTVKLGGSWPGNEAPLNEH